MSKSIIDRLNERIAVEPELDNFDTLFVDLQDARNALYDLNAKVKVLSEAAINAPRPESQSSSAKEVHAILMEAKERLSVNAVGTVEAYLNQAIEILER